ncbi:hypothetical protein SHO565_55460 [Streptomyces sp. HO565]
MDGRCRTESARHGLGVTAFHRGHGNRLTADALGPPGKVHGRALGPGPELRGQIGQVRRACGFHSQSLAPYGPANQRSTDATGETAVLGVDGAWKGRATALSPKK